MNKRRLDERLPVVLHPWRTIEKLNEFKACASKVSVAFAKNIYAVSALSPGRFPVDGDVWIKMTHEGELCVWSDTCSVRAIDYETWGGRVKAIMYDIYPYDSGRSQLGYSYAQFKSYVKGERIPAQPLIAKLYRILPLPLTASPPTLSGLGDTIAGRYFGNKLMATIPPDDLPEEVRRIVASIRKEITKMTGMDPNDDTPLRFLVTSTAQEVGLTYCLNLCPPLPYPPLPYRCSVSTWPSPCWHSWPASTRSTSQVWSSTTRRSSSGRGLSTP